MTQSPQTSRPSETQALLNPAFTAALLARAAKGHRARTQEPMPLPLAFLACPMVLHEATRRALPTRVTHRLAPWLDANQIHRAGMPGRARLLAPVVRSGLRAGVRAGILQLTAGGLVDSIPRRPRGLDLSEEVEEIFDRAQFVGGWLGMSGPPSAVFALWRVRP